MSGLIALIAVVMVALAGHGVAQVVHVVSPDTLGHQAAEPYDTWGNASTNIQVAVDYAEANDLTEVWVSSGLYRLPGMVTVKKGIHLRSWNAADGGLDMANTVIDGDDQFRGFLLDHADIVFEGFTVTNCRMTSTGTFGIAVDMSKGGVVRHCDFAFNRQDSAQTGRGGAVAVRGDGVGVVEHCRFRDNRAIWGGGVNLFSKNHVVISNCVFSGNSAQGAGGGICSYAGAGSEYIVDCVFTNNFSERGGGYANHNSVGVTSLIERCLFVGNIATNDGSSGSSARGGGGVRIAANAEVTLRNCLITKNQAISTYGAGIFFYSATNSWVENCTVVSNHAWSTGGGLRIAGSNVGVGVRNSIVYDNRSDASGGYSNVSSYVDRLMWTNNCVGTTLDLNAYGSGNLLQHAPQFVDPDADDWHLLQASPCVDAGETLDWMIGATDLDGEPRVRYEAVDMGCYETRLQLSTILQIR